MDIMYVFIHVKSHYPEKSPKEILELMENNDLSVLVRKYYTFLYYIFNTITDKEYTMIDLKRHKSFNYFGRPKSKKSRKLSKLRKLRKLRKSRN